VKKENFLKKLFTAFQEINLINVKKRKKDKLYKKKNQRIETMMKPKILENF